MATNAVVMIAVSGIDPGRRPWHSCPYFAPVQVQRLADSMRSAGKILHAVGLRVNAAGTPAAYEVIWGRRRVLAAAPAGLWEIPAVILSVTDDEAAVLSLAENSARSEAPLLQRGWAIADLVAKGHSGVEISKATGLHTTTVSEGKRCGQALPEALLLGVVAERVPLERQKVVVQEVADLGRRPLLAIARDLDRGDRRLLEATIDALSEGRSIRGLANQIRNGGEAGSASGAPQDSPANAALEADALDEVIKQFEATRRALQAAEAAMRERPATPCSPPSPGEDRPRLVRRLARSAKRFLARLVAFVRRSAVANAGG